MSSETEEEQPLRRSAVSFRIPERVSSEKRRATWAGELSWASKARLLQQWNKAEVALLRKRIEQVREQSTVTTGPGTAGEGLVVDPGPAGSAAGCSEPCTPPLKEIVNEYIRINPDNNSVVEAYQLFDPESPQDRTSEYCYALSKGRSDFAKLYADKFNVSNKT